MPVQAQCDQPSVTAQELRRYQDHVDGVDSVCFLDFVPWVGAAPPALTDQICTETALQCCDGSEGAPHCAPHPQVLGNFDSVAAVRSALGGKRIAGPLPVLPIPSGDFLHWQVHRPDRIGRIASAVAARAHTRHASALSSPRWTGERRAPLCGTVDARARMRRPSLAADARRSVGAAQECG